MRSPPKPRQAASTTVPAHMFYDIVRKLPEGAADRARNLRRPRGTVDPRRAFALHAADAAGKRFSRSRAGRDDAQIRAQGRRPQAADRQDAVRHLDRRDALLSQRHLSAHRRRRPRRRRCARSRPTATAWRRPRSTLPDGAAGMPGIIVPRKTVGEVQRLLEDPRGGGGGRIVGGQDPLHGRRGDPDVEADRRHVSGLCARHSGRQRQGAGRRQEGVRGRGRPRLHGFERARPRREAVAFRRTAAAVGDQSRFRQRHRGARGRIRSPSRSISASTRATCSTSPRRSRAKPPCSSSPIPARRR